MKKRGGLDLICMSVSDSLSSVLLSRFNAMDHVIENEITAKRH